MAKKKPSVGDINNWIDQGGRHELESGLDTSAGLSKPLPAAAPTPPPTTNVPLANAGGSVDLNERPITRSDAGVGASTALGVDSALVAPDAASRQGALEATSQKYLNGGEQNLYGQSSVDKVNTLEDQAQESKRTLPAWATRQTGGRGVMPHQPVDPAHTYVAASGAKIMPLMDLKGDHDRHAFVITNYPTLASAAKQAALSDSEVRDAINFTLAYDAAARIGQSANPERQKQLLSTMSLPMQALVVDIINKGIETQKEAQAAAGVQSTGNAVMDTASTIWHWTGGQVMDWLMAANEETQHAVRAAMLAPTTGDWSAAWQQAQAGQYDPVYIAKLKQQYGDKQVQVVLDLEAAHRAGDPNAVGTVINKHAGDPEALSIIDEALNEVNANQDVADMVTKVLAGETGSTGNIVAWSMAAMIGKNDAYSGANSALNPLFGGVKTTADFVTPLLLDPTIAGAKVRAGYIAARYGLAKLAGGAESIEKVFNQRTVRTFFDTMGAANRRISELEQAGRTGEAAQLARSMESQYKNWYRPEALAEMRAAGVHDAATARQYYANAENVQNLIKGQSARRIDRVVVPHMLKSTAVAKLTSLKVRGLTYERMGAQKYLDAVVPGLSGMMPEEAAQVVAERLSSKDGAKEVGRLLGDLVFGDDVAKRTYMGQILDHIPGFQRGTGNAWQRALSRYGWAREQGVKQTGSRVTRLFAVYPDADRPLYILDGRDAKRVRQLMQLAGMPRYWANYVGHIWEAADEGTRKSLISGLGRSYGYARGVDLVDPVKGEDLLNSIVTGLKGTENWSPDYVEATRLRGQAERAAAGTVQKPQSLLDHEALTSADRSALRASMTPDEWQQYLSDRAAERAQHRANVRSAGLQHYQQNVAPNATPLNDSFINDEKSVLYESDLTDRVAFPNIKALDKLTARSAYVTSLLGTNAGVQKLTDWWVLATLVGPRFQVRSGIEDAGLYALTGGKFGSYREGRKISTALREATQRAEAADSTQVRGMKLGFLKTMSRNTGDSAFGSWLVEHLRVNILPHLTPEEIAIANRYAIEGDREALSRLVQKATIRQRFAFFYDPSLNALSQPARIAQMSEKQQEILRYIDDAVMHGDVLDSMNDVAETSMNLVDGSMPAHAQMETTIIDGVEMRLHDIGGAYVSKVVSRNDSASIKAWFRDITKAIHGDGVKGHMAMGRLQRYHHAVLSGNTEREHEIIQEFADALAEHPNFDGERWSIVARNGDQGYYEIANRTLRNLNRIFTGRNGSFNRDLFEKVARSEVDEAGNEFRSFAVFDRDPNTGERVYRLTQDDLAQMNMVPESVIVHDGVKVVVPGSMPLTARAWSSMGRSLARMTREPIYMANYIEARAALAPFEKDIAERFGDEYASKWATEAAADRAFEHTLDYIDNPRIRSQMAWNVRNVARFYRALEDFNRRMMRVTKNEPAAFWKIALGWNVLNDSGFTWDDEFGSKYFVWPGTRAGFEAINAFMNLVGGGDIVSPSLPLAFSSRVNMLTPSADPNSWFPTFSGVYGAVPIKLFMDHFPGLKALENEVLGSYADNSSLLGVMLPPNVSRLLNLREMWTSNPEARAQETDTVFASAARSAVQAYAAAGLFDPSKQYTQTQINQMRSRIDSTAQWIVGLKAVLGPVFPAALSVDVQNTTQYARRLGLDSIRPEFMQVVKANGGDMDKSVLTWLTMNPNLSPFTVPTTGTPDQTGYYGQFQETVDWIESNKSLVDKNPIGASFFAPQKGEATLQAWSALKGMGMKPTVSVNDYFSKIFTAEGKVIYDLAKQEYQRLKAAGDPQAEDKWAYAKSKLYAAYPMLLSGLTGKLATGDRTSSDDYAGTVQSVSDALGWFKSNGGWKPIMDDYKAVIDVYTQFSAKKSALVPGDTQSATGLREMWKNAYPKLAALHPDDKPWQNFVRTVTSALGYEYEAPQ